MAFKPNDRVRLRAEAKIAVQPGVEPGMEGTVLPDSGQNPRTVVSGKPTERLVVVRFDGFKTADLVG